MIARIAFALAALLMTASTVRAAELRALVDDRTLLISGGDDRLSVGLMGWGPDWAWMGWTGEALDEDGVSVGSHTASYQDAPADTVASVRIEQISDRRLQASYRLSSSERQSYTMLALGISPGKTWSGTVRASTASGEQRELTWPVGQAGLGEGITEIALVGEHGTTTISFSRPLEVPSDGELRARLATSLGDDETSELTMTIDLPHPTDFYPNPAAAAADDDGMQDWFTWQPDHRYDPDSVLSMSDWMDQPAGAAGRVERSGDQLRYAGQPLRVWGLNLTFDSGCAPSKAVADRRAAFYAANGVNAVRLHKFADGSGWAGILREGSTTEFDPAGLDRMDYFVAALKAKGIFVKLSASFGSMAIAADAYDSIPYASEWGPRPQGGQRQGTGSGAVFLSRELQDLHIRQMTRLLGHTNPYTGLSYAEDPAIMLVEMANEESALFFGTMTQLQSVPSLRQRIGERFSAWLIERYGSAEAVAARWGSGGIGTFTAEQLHQESFEEGVVFPVGNPWFWSPENIGGSQQHRAPRLYDAALFLAELQDGFYDRYQAALREAGYDGLVMASNWQAGTAASHYLNLHSDARFDVVDRHNYFGGESSMLRIPGGGSLSSGLQQVAGRPFSLSEWIHVFPNQWGAEGPAIIGAYGLGLQGWDISFLFQNGDDGGFSKELGKDQWDVTAPQVMAPFPAIARHVRRGDIAESELVAALNVHYDSLHRGEIGFSDETRQEYDIKLFDSDQVPAETLAVARTAVTFVDQPTPTERFDLEAHRDQEGALLSSTGQLRWMPGDRAESGWFTIDTAATKGVVGFAAGSTHRLGAVTIAPASRYALIYVTAHAQDGTIADDRRLLIVASARASNTGMTYFDGKLVEQGTGPVVMEPVVAEITIDREGAPTVYVCDHNGRRTERTVPVTDGRFTIDGRATRTVYYEVVYE